ncbi:hypothetical protein LJC33_00465 [Eubacteriales bacterium OttesenSCG-928-N13]|nr:hypothetical protein [Eubacteriales bacterium OttesenSCG-928-N13]
MNYPLGRVGIVVHDIYEPNTTYEELDLVPYEGGAYIAKGTTRGNLPTSKEHWVEILVPGVTKEYVDTEDQRLQAEIDGVKEAVDSEDQRLQSEIDGVQDAMDTEDQRLQAEIDGVKETNENHTVNQILEGMVFPTYPEVGCRVAYRTASDATGVPKIARYSEDGEWVLQTLSEADTFRNLEEAGYPMYRVQDGCFVKDTLDADDFASVIYSSTTPEVQNGKIWLKPV